ncbi:MAG: hypothetical protein SF002_09205 [Alphaproteobacteria bacterium]|nr:hypothetical protein [Alphaproteobacteria bacterium]
MIASNQSLGAPAPAEAADRPTQTSTHEGDRLPGFEPGAGPIDRQIRRALKAAVPEAELTVTQAAREAIHEDMPSAHRAALAAALPAAWAAVSRLQDWSAARLQDLADRELRVGALYRALTTAAGERRAALTDRLDVLYADLNRFAHEVRIGIDHHHQAVAAVFSHALRPCPTSLGAPSLASAANQLAARWITQAEQTGSTSPLPAGLRSVAADVLRRTDSLFRFDFTVPKGRGIGAVRAALARLAAGHGHSQDLRLFADVVTAQRDAAALSRRIGLGETDAMD